MPAFIVILFSFALLLIFCMRLLPLRADLDRRCCCGTLFREAALPPRLGLCLERVLQLPAGCRCNRL